MKVEQPSDTVHRADHQQLISKNIKRLQNTSNNDYFLNQRLQEQNIIDQATAQQIQIELANTKDKLSYDVISGNNVNLQQDYFCKSSRSRYQRQMSLM